MRRSSRAKLCSACHVGNVEDGKLVTHEMYAAGHPPLPGIEIVAFCDALRVRSLARPIGLGLAARGDIEEVVGWARQARDQVCVAEPVSSGDAIVGCKILHAILSDA